MNWNVLIPIIATALLNGVVFTIIKLNDLKHIRGEIKDIKKTLDSLWKEINHIKEESKIDGERISKVEGRLNGRINT